MDTPDDDLVRESLVEQQQSEDAGKVASVASVGRKPLSYTPSTNNPVEERPSTPPESHSRRQTRPSEAVRDRKGERCASRGAHLKLNSTTRGAACTANRKPLGPRSIPPRLGSDDSSCIAWNVDGTAFDHAGADSVDHMPTIDRVSTAARPAPKALAEELDLEHAYGNEICNESTRITLIRRDPSSSSQWNVGRIRFPVQFNSEGDAITTVRVDLTTPGYQRFNKEAALWGKAASAPSDAVELKNLVNLNGVTSTTTNTFTRLVAPKAQWDSRQGRKQRHRSNSNDIARVLKQGIGRNPAAQPLLQYAFESPWHGTCSFTTGVDGRSLKCRHILPSFHSQESDPGANVADLRFNLPWMSLRPKDLNVQASSERESKLSPNTTKAYHEHPFKKTVQHLRHRSWVLDSMQRPGLQCSANSAGQQASLNSDFDKVNLTLGQEKAGGGFLGNSAKLGKLVIDNEGLNMCDLVVAACMGIWWQRYSAYNADVP